MEGNGIGRNLDISKIDGKKWNRKEPGILNILDGRKWNWKEPGILKIKWKAMESEGTWKFQKSMEENEIGRNLEMSK